MSEQLMVGDVVMLKSGGPQMTVSSKPDKYGYDDEISVKCKWFENTRILEDLFPTGTLQKI